MAVVSGEIWPNKEFHDEGFKTLPRGKRLTMSAWLSERMLFPKAEAGAGGSAWGSY